MTKIDLDVLSLDELKTLERDVAKAIQNFENRRKKEAVAAIEAVAREHGYALSELTASAPKKKAAAAAKYQHPENPALTWSGRGRRPAWFIEAMENGTPEEELLIA